MAVVDVLPFEHVLERLSIEQVQEMGEDAEAFYEHLDGKEGHYIFGTSEEFMGEFRLWKEVTTILNRAYKHYKTTN